MIRMLTFATPHVACSLGYILALSGSKYMKIWVFPKVTIDCMMPVIAFLEGSWMWWELTAASGGGNDL